MDLVRLARLFSGLRPVGLSAFQHLNPLGATCTGGREGPAGLRAAGLTRPCSSSPSQLPVGQGNGKSSSSLGSDLSQPDPVASQEEEEESFGTLSNKYSSRKIFQKSTAQLYNLRLREQSAEDEETELEPEIWRGRRNTPYWYFFQCKRLIREGKVRGPWDSWFDFPGSPVFRRGCITFLISKYLDAQGSSVFTHPGCCAARSTSHLTFGGPTPCCSFQVSTFSPAFLVCISSYLTSSLTLTHTGLKVRFPALFSLHRLHLTEWPSCHSIHSGQKPSGRP